ncbi:spore germination protein [Paenibacillus sp. LHD-38]|uniref:spore germination protein n=1 Tax=Paenibacillus sp. LHD-38 TaxID=3072143 RepID=UPI00280DF33C|nr:spore germination protein [Paenibacillus sp. LHD-38]MDQ8737745.1 spore germination protein [Paenibacillus sp. LHD-38]
MLRNSSSGHKAEHESSNQALLSTSMKDNVNSIHGILQSPGDLITKEVEAGKTGRTCILLSIDGLIDKTLIHEYLMKPIIEFRYHDTAKETADANHFLQILKDEVLPLQEVQVVYGIEQCLFAILSGDTCLFADGADRALVIGSKGWIRRSIQEPQTESLIRGPKDGFTEDIRTNSSLIRRRIRDPHLRMDSYMIGARSKKEVIVTYIEGVVHPAIVQEVKRRLLTIDIDDAEGSGFIEQWISDSFLSPFPQVMNTERPDRMSSSLLQGRVGILVDGTPFNLILPISIAMALQSPEDYYQPWLLSTLVRLLRLISAFLATFLPGFYIALAEYHHGMIPSNIAFSIAAAREGVPFPVFIEAVLMESTLEILREAGVRLPKPIGQTIGIVGGLVIGEAAVSAGIVSPVMVIVVAVTAIASFTLPAYSFGILTRILRFVVMLAASCFGLFGLILVFLMICIHIVNLKSFGMPYSTPISPMLLQDWKDFILRAPVNFLKKRPEMLQTEDENRMKP